MLLFNGGKHHFLKPQFLGCFQVKRQLNAERSKSIGPEFIIETKSEIRLWERAIVETKLISCLPGFLTYKNNLYLSLKNKKVIDISSRLYTKYVLFLCYFPAGL